MNEMARVSDRMGITVPRVIADALLSWTKVPRRVTTFRFHPVYLPWKPCIERRFIEIAVSLSTKFLGGAQGLSWQIPTEIVVGVCGRSARFILIKPNYAQSFASMHSDTCHKLQIISWLLHS
jgi:hypothetical protein